VTSQSADTFRDLWPTEWRSRLKGAAFTMVTAKGPARRVVHAPLTPPPGPSSDVARLFGPRAAPVSSETMVEDFARSVNEDQADAWFGVCARVAGLDAYHQGRRDQLVACPALWLDVDIGTAGHASKKLPASLEVVVDEYLRKIPIEPTRVHATGGGIHCWWQLDQPIVFATTTAPGHQLAEVQDLMRRWQAQFIAIAQQRGEHVDDTSDLTRILRLPGTSNWKTGTARAVTILAYGGPRVSLDQIREALKDVKPMTVALGGASSPASDAPGLEPWTYDETMEELPKRLRVHAKKRSERASVIGRFLDGKSYSSGGEHHVIRQALVSWIAWLSEGRADVEATCELNRPCYEERSAPVDAFEKFESQLVAALAQAHGKISQAKARDAAILEGLQRRDAADRELAQSLRLVP